MIDITGRLKTSRWKDENDKTHFETSVLVENVEFAPTNNRKPVENSPDTQTAAEAQAQDILPILRNSRKLQTASCRTNKFNFIFPSVIPTGE